MSKIKFTVKGGNGAGTWHDQLQAAIARRAWTAAPPGLLQELHTPPRGMPHTTAGPMTPPVTLLQGLTPPSASLEQHRAATASTADPGMLAQLKAMGFGESEAAAALDATGNAGVQQAATWLLDQGSSSNLLGAAAQALPDPVQPPMPLGASGVGVAGILKREERRAAQTDQALDEAFTSLSQLMAKAEEMVRLATAFRERSAAQRPTTPDGGVSEEEQMDDALARELADLGIASPVTRETAGQLYYQELSRQLAAFIEGAVAEAGGMLPLPEVYRQFCRARFTDLVSPDDVLQAVRKFPEVGAPLCLREFSSGVKVVQAAGVDEDARCKTLAELAMRSSTSTSTSTKDTNHDTVDAAPWVAVLGLGVSRAEAAEALRVPLPVAGEYLSAAEEKGLLCRDDGPEGLRFYRNFFPDVKVG